MKGLLAFLSVCAVLVVVSLGQVRQRQTVVYPPLGALMIERGEGLGDIGGILAGFRGLMADFAWIDFLLYAGGEVLPDEDPARNYDLIDYFVRRVIRIDPFYHSAILYGTSMLAYFRIVDRPNEAVALVKEGIRYDPDYWPYHMFLAAITYKQKADLDGMEDIFTQALRQSDCPMVIRNLIANNSKQDGRFDTALAIWEAVLDSDQAEYWDHAREQIASIRELMMDRREQPSSL